MSAIVCGKRAFFDDIDSSSAASGSPPSYKRLRCSSSTSPVRFSYLPPPVHTMDRLVATFPDMEMKLLEQVLEESGNDFDSAITRVHELHLVCDKSFPGLAAQDVQEDEQGPTGEDARKSVPINGAEWVELIVKEMMSATSIDDAKSRAAHVLESLEKSISARTRAEAAENSHKENVMMKEQIEALLRDNAILKRAVAIQHERQKEYDEKNQEAQHLKVMVAQYQERVRNLEVNNYALQLHLRQAEHHNNIPNRFNPDVF